VVGGIASVTGAIVGGLFITFVPDWSEEFALWISTWTAIAEESAKGLTWAIYGVFLILVIYVMPAGAAGLARLVVQRLARP
jgi:branched-chain amino acid transport system permease protein